MKEPVYHRNDMTQYVEFTVKGKLEKMPKDQFVRWACLIEAMDVISQKCDQLKLERSDTSWIKPNAIGKYINDRFLSMQYSLDKEIKETSSHQHPATVGVHFPKPQLAAL